MSGSGVEEPAVDAGKTSQALVETLKRVVEPTVEREGYELVDLELAGDRKGPIVRLYIDTVPPSTETQSVSIDDCTHVSRCVSAILDETDPVTGEYRLEVSSPGIYRPLTKPEHFARALGARVRIKTYEKIDGRRVFIGTLREQTETCLQVEVDGQPFEVPTAQVAKANLEPVFD